MMGTYSKIKFKNYFILKIRHKTSHGNLHKKKEDLVIKEKTLILSDKNSFQCHIQLSSSLPQTHGICFLFLSNLTV